MQHISKNVQECIDVCHADYMCIYVYVYMCICVYIVYVFMCICIMSSVYVYMYMCIFGAGLNGSGQLFYKKFISGASKKTYECIQWYSLQ